MTPEFRKYELSNPVNMSSEKHAENNIESNGIVEMRFFNVIFFIF